MLRLSIRHLSGVGVNQDLSQIDEQKGRIRCHLAPQRRAYSRNQVQLVKAPDTQ
jgi:hypothetical protein